MRFNWSTPDDCAKTVRRIRQKVKLSRQMLARKLRMGTHGHCTVYRWETGQRQPSPQMQLLLEAVAGDEAFMDLT